MRDVHLQDEAALATVADMINNVGRTGCVEVNVPWNSVDKNFHLGE